MTDDQPDDPIDDDAPGALTDMVHPIDETSAQKALRLKQARLDARPQPPRGGRFQREQAARIAAGLSRPWMRR